MQGVWIIKNLIEGLQREIKKVNEIITEYESLPKNTGAFAAGMMRVSIKKAESEMALGNTIEMIKAFKNLEGFEL